jgi:hypothetical protein
MFKPLIAFLLVVAQFGASSAQTRLQNKRSTGNQTSSASRDSASDDRPLSLGSIDEVLWWLPEDTETVSVVRGPFKVPGDSESPATITPNDYVALALTGFNLGLLNSLRRGRFYKSIVGSNVKFSISGSRKFQSPTGLGGMLFEGCEITVFDSGIPSRSTLIRRMTPLAKQVLTIGGHRVLMFEQELEEDVWKIYVAFPAPNVLLCASNEDFLTQVLKRMYQRGDKRALPENLPEWKQVNTNAKFWSVRHYQRTDTPLDPSSPLSGEDLEASWSDAEATGIVLDFDPGRSASVTVKYLSRNKDVLRLFSDYHTKIEQGFKPVIRLREPGVVEMIVPFDTDDRGGISLLVLLTLLGHSIYT